ncbi:unannotated protein [freshwater metagenome]|uniref:Unannotated protein n=1 Tax=freshwater metagenome TaxID=449393 RepID=A0A6J6FGZ7_9ZZZZ
MIFLGPKRRPSPSLRRGSVNETTGKSLQTISPAPSKPWEFSSSILSTCSSGVTTSLCLLDWETTTQESSTICSFQNTPRPLTSSTGCTKRPLSPSNRGHCGNSKCRLRASGTHNPGSGWLNTANSPTRYSRGCGKTGRPPSVNSTTRKAHSVARGGIGATRSERSKNFSTAA